MDYNCVLLAAGRGTRLGHLTKNWPKCLMPIHGRPLMDYWLDEIFKISPITTFVNTYYLSNIVESYLSRDLFKGKITILREARLLGTGGTISGIGHRLLKNPTLVIHADNWCGINLKKLLSSHEKLKPKKCPITMVTFYSCQPETCGIVHLNEEKVVQAFYEKDRNAKGNIANGAIYVFEPEVIQWIMKNNSIDLSLDVLPEFISRIFTVHNDTFHRDIGSLDNLVEAQYDYNKNVSFPDHDNWMMEFQKNQIHKQISRLKKSTGI